MQLDVGIKFTSGLGFWCRFYSTGYLLRICSSPRVERLLRIALNFSLVVLLLIHGQLDFLDLFLRVFHPDGKNIPANAYQEWAVNDGDVGYK